MQHMRDIWRGLDDSEIQHAGDFGLTVENVGYDFPRIQAYREKVVTDNWKGVQFLMKKNRITVLEGDGRIVGTGQIHLRGKDGQEQLQTSLAVSPLRHAE